MVTAVLFVNQATPTTITKFHDMIMNQLPETLPPWEFELGIFLNNKFSKPTNMDPKQVPNRYLYTLQLSYLNEEERGNRMISIINNNKSVVTCVPNSANILNSLESFTNKGLKYYGEEDEEEEREDKKSSQDALQHEEPGIKKEDDIIMENNDDEIQNVTKIENEEKNREKDDEVDEDIEMFGPESDSDGVVEQEVKPGSGDDNKEVDLETEVDDDVVLSKFESNSLDEMRRRKKLLQHIQNGCCNNLNVQTKENLEYMLVSKLQSLWTLKQTIRGQGGLGYTVNVQLDEIDGTKDEESKETRKTNEKFRLRTSNCLLHGLFKGFLIEIEHLDDEMKILEIDNELKNITETERKNRLILRFSRSITMIKSLIETYNFPEGNLCFNVLSDSKLDYLSDLCQQYCDALQF